ncbi:hypothetical protein SFC76_01425 [Sphingomonas sp. CD22]|uniref:hypothetical protein n=1 Tax=Sphingomonas sp. CD22 TaxID=3100214 RepID=UPI002AE03704|nr:hypothetical protein [Sphingomonas sp. CD22]MEA1082905.1 hypothetical protein [Sphingomonas sp. CD22]
MLTYLLLAGALAAPPAGPDLLQTFTQCRTVADNGARLACYDRAAQAMDDARRKKDIVVLDRKEVQKAKRSMFGFSLPSIKLFGDGEDDEQLKQLVGTLRSSTGLPGGLMRFALDDGGVWETTEQAMVRLREGDVVTIKAGPLGSYIANAPGRRAVRVHRLR